MLSLVLIPQYRKISYMNILRSADYILCSFCAIAENKKKIEEWEPNQNIIILFSILKFQCYYEPITSIDYRRAPECHPQKYHVIYIYIFFSYNIIYFCRRCNYSSASVDVSPTEDIIFSFFVANTTSPINDFYSI